VFAGETSDADLAPHQRYSKALKLSDLSTAGYMSPNMGKVVDKRADIGCLVVSCSRCFQASSRLQVKPHRLTLASVVRGEPSGTSYRRQHRVGETIDQALPEKDVSVDYETSVMRGLIWIRLTRRRVLS
jgi:hypothetical protein